MSLIISLVQKVFFKKMKMPPQERWVRRADSQGCFSKFFVFRDEKKIACYSIGPPARQSLNQEDPIVLLSHPISRKAKYFFTDTNRSAVYLNRGLTVFAFDYNGFGESDIIDLYYWRDVVAVLEYLKTHFPSRRILLHGASFGAFHIIRALDHLPQKSSVILENVNKSLISYWRRWPLTGLLVRLLMFLRIRAVLEMDVQRVFREFERPDLHIHFIACEQDDYTTLAEMQELYSDLVTSNKAFSVFSGAGHLAAPIKDPALYRAALFAEGYDYAQ